jgi:hypothetical protein
MTDNIDLIESFGSFNKRHAGLVLLANQKAVQSEPPDVLYHYTNSNAAIEIVGKKEIRAGHVLFMNDSTELRYGIGLYSTFLENPYEVAHPKEFAQFRDEFLPEPKTVMADSPVYAFCLSVEGNDLSQWRAYGSRGTGYALGFDSAGLLKLRFEGTSFEYFKVIYDHEIQKALLKDFLYSTFNWLMSERETGIEITEADRDILRLYFLDWLQSILLRMKRYDFHHENEWRLTFRNLRGLRNSTDPDFRVSEAGIFVPYCPLKPEEGQLLPLRRIIIGPSSNGRAAWLGMHKFLAKHRYGDVELMDCGIPIQSI